MSTLRAIHPYTATDPGSDVPADRLRVWQNTRARLATFVSAVVCSPTEAAGPAYADSDAWDPRPEAQAQAELRVESPTTLNDEEPIHPTMVLVDDLLCRSQAFTPERRRSTLRSCCRHGAGVIGPGVRQARWAPGQAEQAQGHSLQ